MKKTMFFFFLLVVLIPLGGNAQIKPIGTAGAGLFQSDKTTGDYEFVEGRIMFGKKLRVGLMGNYTWVYLKEKKEDPYYYKGRLGAIGLSTDRWWQTYSSNRYFWINSGIRFSYDRGATSNYRSWQKDLLSMSQFGFRSTNVFGSWGGNSLLMLEAQIPLKKGDQRYSTESGVVSAGTPYEKGGYKISYENGIKKIPVSVRFTSFFIEPTAHIGSGFDNASDRLSVEYGGGISVGYSNDGWDRDLFKIKAFNRQYLDGSPSKMQIELVLNLLNFKK